MFVVVANKTKDYTKIIRTDNLNEIQILYTEFLYDDDIDVDQSWYPERFLETLEFEDNIVMITSQKLRSLFYTWCIKNAKKYYNDLRKKRTIVEDIQTVIQVEEEFQVNLDEDKECKKEELEVVPYLSEIDDMNDVNGYSINKRNNLVLDIYQKLEPFVGNITSNMFNNVNENVIMAIFFTQAEKTKIAYVDKKDINILSKFKEFGIDDIQIRHVMFLPSKEVSMNLVNHYCDTIEIDTINFLKCIYKIYKFVNLEKTKGINLRGVIEFLYNNYEFDTSSSIPIVDMYKEFYGYNKRHQRFSLSEDITINRFFDILKSMFIDVDDNNVKYFRCRSVPLNVTDDVKKNLNKFRLKRCLQLREEPSCFVNIKNIPWNINSELQIY